MESANYHIQTGQLASSSAAADWNQNFNLNNSNPKTLNPNFSNLMIQELGFNSHWNATTNQFGDHIQQIGKIKEEQKYMNDILCEKLLMKTISSGFSINCCSDQLMASNLYPSQIHPCFKISNLNRSPAEVLPGISPDSFDVNLEALDLLTSARFRGNFEQPFSHNTLSLYEDNNVMQHSTHIPSPNPIKIPCSSSSTNEITESKRPSNSFKPTQAAPKKSRLDSRTSCLPIKVRKEKLGDRIATLQQLVAPFGKTDTASVLMEAIGYINFLQNQVETLSVPYMKSSRNKSSKTTNGVSKTGEGNDDRKKDLRSRGLCLVPLSCMSYVTGDSCSGGGLWPPPNFGGGTI